MGSGDTHRAIEAVWRIESARLIAGLTRITRDVGTAEELAQDALVAALEQWPAAGIPDNPGAWLMAAAKNRAIDQLRHRKMQQRKQDQLHFEHELRQELAEEDFEAAVEDELGDDLLRLIFTACHPVLSTEARVALTLKLLCGLSVAEIARAFLAPEATVAQRIVRAKRTLAEARVPFEVPKGPELNARLASVLEVIYLVFNEGYSATAGDDWVRPALCHDALRLGRILASLAPREPEVHGLVHGWAPAASRCCSWTRIGAAGTTCWCSADSRPCAMRSSWAEDYDLTCCRRRSPPAMPAPAPPRRPTGNASWRSMTHWPRSSLRRWWN